MRKRTKADRIKSQAATVRRKMNRIVRAQEAQGDEPDPTAVLTCVICGDPAQDDICVFCGVLIEASRESITILARAYRYVWHDGCTIPPKQPVKMPDYTPE